MIKFGFDSWQLPYVARELERLFNAGFKLHSSEYRGGDYFRAEVGPGAMILQQNYDPVEKEAFEPTWPDGKAILYLDGPDDPAWHSFVDLLQSEASKLGATYLGTSIG